MSRSYSRVDFAGGMSWQTSPFGAGAWLLAMDRKCFFGNELQCTSWFRTETAQGVGQPESEVTVGSLEQ